jgi:hypothetical protein
MLISGPMPAGSPVAMAMIGRASLEVMLCPLGVFAYCG